MKNILFGPVALLAILCLTGCQAPRVVSASGGNPVAVATRNNSYSLLYDLLSEQKDVSILRFIKPEHTDVKNLVKRIAKSSGAGAKLLKEFAQADPSIKLDYLGLPPGESATREAIAATKKKALLGQTGEEFELTLLLTQTEALTYAGHLAGVAAKYDPDPQRAEALLNLSTEMKTLYQEVFTLMLAKTQRTAEAK